MPNKMPKTRSKNSLEDYYIFLPDLLLTTKNSTLFSRTLFPDNDNDNLTH